MKVFFRLLVINAFLTTLPVYSSDIYLYDIVVGNYAKTPNKAVVIVVFQEEKKTWAFPETDQLELNFLKPPVHLIEDNLFARILLYDNISKATLTTRALPVMALVKAASLCHLLGYPTDQQHQIYQFVVADGEKPTVQHNTIFDKYCLQLLARDAVRDKKDIFRKCLTRYNIPFPVPFKLNLLFTKPVGTQLHNAFSFSKPSKKRQKNIAPLLIVPKNLTLGYFFQVPEYSVVEQQLLSLGSKIKSNKRQFILKYNIKIIKNELFLVPKNKTLNILEKLKNSLRDFLEVYFHDNAGNYQIPVLDLEVLEKADRSLLSRKLEEQSPPSVIEISIDALSAESEADNIPHFREYDPSNVKNWSFLGYRKIIMKFI